MSNFFNTYFNVKEIIEKKREYKQHLERIKKLPDDYQYTYNKVQNYMWSFASGDGYDMLDIQVGILELFEDGVASGKTVLEITGEDVADFVDELLKGADKYTDTWRKKLNSDIIKKVKGK